LAESLLRDAKRMLSIIITSYNEGPEVRATLESIKANTSNFEIVLVDDGSTDGSCIDAGADRIVRHEQRMGIAISRLDGANIAAGDCFAFLDAHQRVDEGCLNKCAELALERQAIVWPDVKGLGNSRWTGHGANMRQKNGKKAGLFDAEWKTTKPVDAISRSATMIVPGYVIPRSIWPKVKPPQGLKWHGASEPAISVPAFFTDIDILHLCGPLARHRFTEGHHLPYECPWSVTSRNHALVARVFFTVDTWERYWLGIFRRHLKDEGLKEFYEPHIMDQQRAFEGLKKRPDEEFWRGLMLSPVPFRAQ
jgi:glycosyltransferase involved in cell wall biosynthesis